MYLCIKYVARNWPGLEDDSTWHCNKFYLMLSMHKTQFRKIQFVQDKNTWKYPAQNENEKKICGYFYLEQIVFFLNFCVAQSRTMRAGLNTSLKDCKKMTYLISAEREFAFLSWGFGLEERFPKEDFFFLQWDKIAVMMHAPCMHVGADSLKNIDYWFFFVFQPGANH